VASASPSTSSATISSGRPDCTTLSSNGRSGCSDESFFSWIRIYGLSSSQIIFSAFDDIELGLQALRLFDRDDAFLADLLHCLGDHLANFGLAVGRDGADLGDFVVGRDLLRTALQVRDHRFDGDVDAALQVHRVHARGDRLGAFAHDRLSQNRRGGGAVAGEIGRLARDLAQHLRAHVLELVGELDLLGDSYAVLGGTRRAERLVDHHVAALGPERDLDRVGQDVHATQHPRAGIAAETYFFRCHFRVSLLRVGSD
jgi:hypothetical protein